MHFPEIISPQQSGEESDYFDGLTSSGDCSPGIQHSHMKQKDSGSTATNPTTSLPDNSGRLTTQNGLYKCSSCPKTFPRLGQKHKHELNHSKPAKCKEAHCHRAFATKKDLRRHHDSKHRDKRTLYTYIGCNMTFTRDDNLARHIRNKHS